MEALRKISISFQTEENLQELSKKIFGEADQQLRQNLRSVTLTETGADFVFRQTVRRAPAEMKEWEKHWKDLTPYSNDRDEAFCQIDFYFPEDYTNEKLAELLEQGITPKTKSIQFPKQETRSVNLKRIIGDRGNPQYPIYIISKGRSQRCVTADHLIKMEVPFNIVIEKEQWDDYAAVYGDEPLCTLVELDMSFRDAYDTYIEDFDDTKSKGSGPARNFVWFHSKHIAKAKWHWIIDDNIFGFYYYNKHERVKAVDGTLFAAAEDFVNRYENIGISGLNYYMFAVPGSKIRPYVANTKIYSCLLINNDAHVRWAGRYNEDVDICIRALKEGYATIQFDAFLSKKAATQTFGGGNTEAFYAEEGTLPKSNMLAWNHPDITKVMWRFQRWHHITNYDIFDYYKDRTIAQTIEDMMRPPVLDAVADKEIIEEIRGIDFERIKKWDILETVEPSKREEILKILKFYRYTKDNDRIIGYLTAPKILDSDYYDFIWDAEIPDTLDNRIMKDLLGLANDEGMLFYAVDWDSVLSYVPEDRRALIAAEMKRNKYLQKPYEKQTYNLKEVYLKPEEHEEHRDSKAEMYNKYKGTNKEVKATLFDQKMRGEIKINQNRGFKNQLSHRSAEVVKEPDKYVVLIHGSEDFDNEKLFEEKMKELNPQMQELANCVEYPVDLMNANYALNNKIPSRDFVPNHEMYTITAYKKLYAEIANYADECVLFVSTMTPDLEFLVEEFKKQNKPVQINYDNVLETLDGW